MESVNDLPPFLGPTFPIYPPYEQCCRITGKADSNGVYPAFTQQLFQTSPPRYRDREPCFVFEPNGIVLGQAIYDCRLEGSYQGAPLYATTCCGGGSSSSSSSSGSSSSQSSGR